MRNGTATVPRRENYKPFISDHIRTIDRRVGTRRPFNRLKDGTAWWTRVEDKSWQNEQEYWH